MEVFFALLLMLYLLPCFVAMSRGVAGPQKNGIAVLNLLLGWTLVGWVVALVWATAAPKARD